MATKVTSGGKTSRTGDVLERTPAGSLAVPYRDVIGQESITLGFRQQMLSVGNPKKPEHGGVACGNGLGTDFIILEWKGKVALVRGSEIFKLWVATFDPESAKGMGF
jgi:hypothetical protein